MNATTFCIVLATALAAVVGFVAFFGKILPAQQPGVPDPNDRQAVVLGSRINYQTYGSGEPVILLLHGFGGSGRGHWAEVATRISCGRVVSLDLLGFGASDRPKVPYTLAMHVQYVLGFMDELGIRRAIVGGSSMGGSITAMLGATAPDRVEALALFAPSGTPGSLTYPGAKGASFRPGVMNRLAKLATRIPLFDWLFPDSLARQGLGVTGTYDEEFVASLEHIQAPTLLAWSRSDDRVPFSDARLYEQRVRNLAFREAPADAGHPIGITKPEWTAETLCEFVTSLNGDRGSGSRQYR